MERAREFCQSRAKLKAILMSATAASSAAPVLEAVSQNGLPNRPASDSLRRERLALGGTSTATVSAAVSFYEAARS